MLKKARNKIIRLRKKGIIYYPIYDIVVSYKDNRNRGLIIEKLGFYNPHVNKKLIYINSFRLSYWLNKGVMLNKNIKKYLVKFLLN
jgi:ribosomal protein S16